MKHKLKVLDLLIKNSELLFKDGEPTDPPEPPANIVDPPKRPAGRNQPNTPNISVEDIQKILDVTKQQQDQISALMKEREDILEQVKSKDSNENLQEEKSAEALRDLVKNELDAIKKENQRIKEESEIKDYRNEIIESKPWLKDNFKVLLSKGGLSTKKEIDNAVLMLDTLVKEKWESENISQLAGTSVEAITNMARNTSPSQKPMTPEEIKAKQKEEYRKMYEADLNKIYN